MMLSRVARVAAISFVGLLIAMIYLGAIGISAQRSSATIASVASREQSLVERYVQEVLLRADGQPVDPNATIAKMTSTNLALLNGGTVAAMPGSPNDKITIPAATDPTVRAQLQREMAFIVRLGRQGQALLRQPSQSAAYEARLSALRATRTDLTRATQDLADAVLQGDSRRVDRLVHFEIGFGILGMMAALGLGAIFWRSGRQSESARFQSLVSHATDLLLTTNAKGIVTFASPSSVEILGLSQRELFGTRSADLIHPDDRTYVSAKMFSILGTPNRTVSTCCRIRHADGRWLSFELSYTNLLKDSAVRGIVINGHDITAQGELTRELADQAFHDSLTGLANRLLLRDRLEHALAQTRRSGQVVSILFCDLDNFKIINDTLGHEAGDRVLIEVAERLHATVRDGDTIARLGGDEFAIICENATSTESAQTAARILDALRRPIAIDDREVVISASIGSADNRSDALDADELLSRADIAMYVAKAHGRDRYEAFARHMQRELLERHELHGDLRRALEHDELTVHYQPLVELDTGHIESFEALVRWNHPTKGQIEPDDFIPLAEETGLILPVGRYVLREACRQTALWHATGMTGISIGVNVAAQQLLDPDFIKDVSDALEQSALAPQFLTLELTETTLLTDTTLVAERLHELKHLGVRIAIDDFGTGYSSLAYLRDFPVDYLKIDRSFVAELAGERSEHGLTMVNSIIALSHNLKLTVVAEGIEETCQRDHLRRSGCNSGQGYLYSRPLTSDDATRLLSDSNATSGTIQP
ncbi:MAG TPA: EAL domain-containing protein [Gemmatimonadaceae bacterium]|nr:EAL domain-containing protein [Gemmatimonadaceae bacterium]